MYCKHCGREIDDNSSFCSQGSGGAFQAFQGHPLQRPDERKDDKGIVINNGRLEIRKQ